MFFWNKTSGNATQSAQYCDNTYWLVACFIQRSFIWT